MKGKFKLTHRAARKEDAHIIAQAVVMAIGEECAADYCGDNYLAVIEDIARQEDSQYSYTNSIIAEIDGNPAGAVCGYDGALLQRLRARTLEVISRETGHTPKVADETGPGEFYIDSIGILPQYRGRGLGGDLLRAIRDEAFQQGHPIVGLLVDENNPRAEALYRKLGFRRMDTANFMGHRMWHLQTREDAIFVEDGPGKP